MSDVVREYTPATTAAGLTGLGWKTFKDLERLNTLGKKWDSNLLDFRKALPWKTLEETNFKVNPESADRIFDTYIRDARKLARSRVFGIPVGQLVQRANPTAGTHYDFFTNPKYTSKDARLHMVLKAWNANAGDSRKLSLGGAAHLPEMTRIEDLESIKKSPMPAPLQKAWKSIITSRKNLKISDMVKRLENAAHKTELYEGR